MKQIAKKLAFVVLFCIVVIAVIGQLRYYTPGQKLVAKDASVPQWSKDGKSIYWYESPRLSFYNVDNGESKTINLISEYSLDDLSPDNKYFVGCDEYRHDLAIKSIKSGKSSVIYHTKSKVYSPFWISNDLILFALYPEKVIYTIHVDGTGLARVCEGAYIENVSSDGTEFVYSTRPLEGYRKFYDLKYQTSKDFKENYKIKDPKMYPLVRFSYLSRNAAVYFRFNNGRVDYWLLDLKTMKETPLYISRVTTVPMQQATISPDLSYYMWERRNPNNGHSKLYVAKLPAETIEKIEHVESKN